jgi:hypothetical protein
VYELYVQASITVLLLCCIVNKTDMSARSGNALRTEYMTMLQLQCVQQTSTATAHKGSFKTVTDFSVSHNTVIGAAFEAEALYWSVEQQWQLQ